MAQAIASDNTKKKKVSNYTRENLSEEYFAIPILSGPQSIITAQSSLSLAQVLSHQPTHSPSIALWIPGVSLTVREKETFLSKKDWFADVTFGILHPLCCHASESLGSSPTLYFLLFLLNLEMGDNNSFHGSYKYYMAYIQIICHQVIQAHFLPPVSWRVELVLWLVACWAKVCLGIRVRLKLNQLLKTVKMNDPEFR